MPDFLNSSKDFVSNHRWVSSVPPNFVNEFADGKESGYNNYPAWFMDIEKDRITIIKQESGIDPLAALSKACKYLIPFQELMKSRADNLSVSPGLEDEK